MNKLVQLLLLLGVVCVAGGHDDGHHGCVPDWRAREIIPIFQSFFSDGNVKLIKDTLTSDFTIYSDSQEFTTPGITPVSGDAVVKGRDAFIAANAPHSGAPNAFVTLDSFWTCRKIVFRWAAPGGLGGKIPIRGIDTLDLAREGGRWKIKTDYSEYNNVGFLQGVGVCTIC
ncbi:hypothetical protein NOR_05025 [Metarhizium rileyi]|uniref:NTF2-like domain-containing protein n=1 Tax=Metarhizium rileyi (strain RCEF 4871) TaxID=1649241 RepID=A0A167DBR1_METRR|nr:hypothetical protein NOR_05025 [Metarhizium rileyi RCEF 4871]TWU72522.1 hypothetical protein ED733_003314 [Metarhizium rileyi]